MQNWGQLLLAIVAISLGTPGAFAQPETGLDCSQYSPPTGYDHEVAQEPATTPNAQQVAMNRAVEQLVDKHCRDTGACAALRAMIKRWQTGRLSGTTCAMAVVDEKDLAGWKRNTGSLEGFDSELRKAARSLTENALSGKAPRVAVGAIEDDGMRGGSRATWLQGRMKAALARSSVQIVDIPAGWNGRRTPRGVDIVLTAKTLRIAEGRYRRIEVQWSARLCRPERQCATRSAVASFPEDAGPREKEQRKLPAGAGVVSLHVESKRGGSLCLGERTQIWLHSKESLFVRVFDLYADGKALLIFPNELQPEDRVKAGDTIPLGGKHGFEAEPYPGYDQDRFLVVAARTREGLGSYAQYTKTCRVPPQEAKRLHQGKLPDGTLWNWTDFRLIDTKACSAPPTPGTRAGVAMQLQELPRCR